MIGEIEVGKAGKAIIDSRFIADTVKRINEMPLSELESRLPEFVQRRNQNAFVLGGVLERIRREKFWNPGAKQPKNALFERWVEETCHYSGRKARYLISVYLGLVWSKQRFLRQRSRTSVGRSFV
jgi:hypothetical protein